MSELTEEDEDGRETDEREAPCRKCGKRTPHRFVYSGHERDSSGDIRTCLTCGERVSGFSPDFYRGF